MRNVIWATPVILAGMQICAFADVIPPGTQVPVRTDQPIEMHTWERGRIYPARVAQDVYARDGDVAIRRGSYAELIVRQIGPHQMALDLESVTVNGQRYVMDTSGPAFNTRRQDYEDGGGLLGNIVGAISGAEVRGDEIRVPRDSVITFQLQEPLHVADWGDRGYEREGHHYHRDNDWYH